MAGIPLILKLENHPHGFSVFVSEDSSHQCLVISSGSQNGWHEIIHVLSIFHVFFLTNVDFVII